MSAKNIIIEELGQRIITMKNLISSAELCLQDEDYVQCAVRLEMAANQGKFDDFMMRIFEALTEAE